MQVTMGLLFYPRGGSAQVARYLAAALGRDGRPVRLVTGSLGPPGAATNAETFFAGLDVHAADFTPALEAWEHGADPMVQPMPMHPSYERREGVPDRIFTELDDECARRQVDAWTRVFEQAGCGAGDLFHLHHLTPHHLAVAERWPDASVVAHLHGTELKMLDTFDASDPWSRRLVEAARHADRLIAISPHDRDEAVRLLGVDTDRVTVVPNGVDVTVFDRRRVGDAARLAQWHRWLVDDPLGWDESGRVGSVRYTRDDLADFVGDGDEALPVLMFVGRFLGFKRVPLLVRAYHRAREQMRRPVPLVVWGGSPGEWEGEHPVTLARELGTRGIFFVGWRGHDELPDGLNAADVLVAPSTDEPFGQVYLEAMACGLPVIATRSGGPPTFVDTDSGHPNGWLVEPDDEDALVAAIVAAADDDDERRARGEAAYTQIRGSYSWDTIATRVGAIHDELAAR